MQHYMAMHAALPVLRYRLGSDISIQGVDYGEVFSINGVRISFHPAGHIWGSAQIRLEYKGEVWVVSGDYKLQNDHISTPFELIPCHHFITESTFGLPVYNFPSVDDVHNDINKWWKQNKEEGKNSVILGYALGKAQRIINKLDLSIGNIYTHGAVDNINKLYEQHIGKLPAYKRIDWETNTKALDGAIIVAPPSAAGTPWLRKLQPYKLAFCSGWMQLRGARRRRGADKGFIMSDHCDWEQLNTAVTGTGAENIYVTHGYKSIYAKWLEATYGLNAKEVDTLYTGEEIEGGQETDLNPDTDETI
jgi:putative mRNA 3-end processing factor